jgi:predicted RNase H-like nuclease (RuvC/YqgF family)
MASRGTPRSRGADVGSRADDEVLKLQEENAALKRHNLEQGEKMRQLGVQMQRIRADMASGSLGKSVPLVERARAAQVASKDEKIAQLEMEVAQRDAAQRKLAQQLTLYKQTSTSGARGGAGRPGAARPALKRRQPNVPVPPAAFAPRSSSARASVDGALPPRTPPRSPAHRSSAVEAASPATLTHVAAAAAVAALGQGDADQLGSLLRMLQEKDLQIEQLRAMQAAQPTQPEPGSAAEAVAATARVPPPGGTSGGSSETVQMLEIRRSLKERTAQLTLLTQRYDHLNGRFESVRANHEKVLAQMNDLNRLIREERTENTRLRQQVQHLQIVRVRNRCWLGNALGGRLKCGGEANGEAGVRGAGTIGEAGGA